MSEKQKHQVIRSQIDETKEEKRRREIEKEKKRAHEKPDNVDFHIQWNIIIKVFEDGFTTIHCVILWIA